MSAVTAVRQAACNGLLVSDDDFVACGFVKGVFKMRVDSITIVPRSDLLRFAAVPEGSGDFAVETMTQTGSLSMVILRHLTNPSLEAMLITA